MTVRYFIVASDERGIADAMARGWKRLAWARFATAENDDIRMVRRFAEFIPIPGKMALVKGADYEDGPPDVPEGRVAQWLKEKAEFDKFVASGAAEWVDA